MNSSIRIFLWTAVALIAVVASGSAEADVQPWSADFETPEYSAARDYLPGQNGWTGTAYSSKGAAVDDVHSAASGDQYGVSYAIDRGDSGTLVCSNVFADTAIDTTVESFLFRGYLRANNLKDNATLHINDSSLASSFYGVTVGFRDNDSSGDFELVYRDGDDYYVIDVDPLTAGIQESVENVWYGIDISVSGSNYGLTVKNLNGEVLSSYNAASRGGITDFDRVEIIHYYEPGGTQELAFDNFQVVPEPMTMVLLGSGAVLVISRRRKN